MNHDQQITSRGNYAVSHIGINRDIRLTRSQLLRSSPNAHFFNVLGALSVTCDWKKSSGPVRGRARVQRAASASVLEGVVGQSGPRTGYVQLSECRAISHIHTVVMMHIKNANNIDRINDDDLGNL